MSKLITAVAVGAVAVATIATVASSQQPPQPQFNEAPSISATNSNSAEPSYNQLQELEKKWAREAPQFQ